MIILINQKDKRQQNWPFNPYLPIGLSPSLGPVDMVPICLPPTQKSATVAKMHSLLIF